MIGVVMRDDQPVYLLRSCFEKLGTKVWPTINENGLSAQLGKEGAPHSPVLWLVGIAVAPVVANARNPG